MFCFSDFDIFGAVGSDQLEILKLFLKTRVDKNPVIRIDPDNGDEGSVLHFAAFWGHLNIIVYYKDVLQFSNINPKSNNGITPLYLASLYSHFDIAEYYIKNGYKASSKVSIYSLTQNKRSPTFIDLFRVYDSN